MTNGAEVLEATCQQFIFDPAQNPTLLSTYPTMRTILILVKRPQPQRADVAGDVVAGCNRVVDDGIGANKADLRLLPIFCLVLGLISVLESWRFSRLKGSSVFVGRPGDRTACVAVPCLSAPAPSSPSTSTRAISSAAASRTSASSTSASVAVAPRSGLRWPIGSSALVSRCDPAG
jgi:hypothetical protein